MDKSINNSGKRTVIQVAVGIITNSKGQLLIAKRPDHWLGGGFWEFPGGKIESSEDSLSALKRELLEEVGIVAGECSPLIRLIYDYPERTVILDAWNVHSFTGEAAGLEGQEICWTAPTLLNEINMLPANRAIVVACQLPDTYFITPECINPNSFLETLKSTLQQQQIKLLQLRSKNLNREEYIALAKKVLVLCRQRQVLLLLNHDDIGIIDEIDADGIHLESQQIASLDKRPLSKDKWVCGSCHNLQQILKAEKVGVDFLTISPVHKSISQFEVLGWEGFAQLTSSANVPVYALGGMTMNDVMMAKNQGGQGISFVLEELVVNTPAHAAC